MRATLHEELVDLGEKIASHLAGKDEYLLAAYRQLPNRHPLEGHCYVAAEVLFHVRAAVYGYVPASLRVPGQAGAHWFLLHPVTLNVLDPTARQFEEPVPYHFARGRGFLTAYPSKRAQRVMEELGWR